MKRKTNRRKPPSRVRYEETHPTISVRVDRELRDRLDQIKTLEGKSIRDILRVGVGLQEVAAEQSYECGFVYGRGRGQDEGHQRGFEEAKRRYLVQYRCPGCGDLMEVSSDNAKRAAREYMEERGWGHRECVQ